MNSITRTAFGDFAEAIFRGIVRVIIEAIGEAMVSLIPERIRRWANLAAVLLIFGAILTAAIRWIMASP